MFRKYPGFLRRRSICEKGVSIPAPADPGKTFVMLIGGIGWSALTMVAPMNRGLKPGKIGTGQTTQPGTYNGCPDE